MLAPMSMPFSYIWRFLAAAGIAAGLLLPSVATADLKSGVAAYRAGDYETALREFTKLAADGNAHAEFNLAILYLTGRGVEKDIARSIELHKGAASKGLPAAMHGLGVFYYQGIGVKRDYGKALEWFRKSAAAGFADSEFNIGVMYFNRQGVARDDVEVVKWVSLAASRKFSPAEFRLGQMYEKGVIFRKNLREALYWYRLAATHGNKNAPAAITRVERDLRGPPLRTDKGREQLSHVSTPSPPAEKASTSTAKKPEDEFSVSLPEQTPDDRASAIPEPPVRDRPARQAKPAKPPPMNLTSQIPAETPASPLKPAPKRPPAPKPAEEREWRVQFASFRTEAEAEKAWKRISETVAGALGDMKRIVARADLGERGVYHRLQVGPLNSRADAVSLCARIKAEMADQDCLPVRTRVR